MVAMFVVKEIGGVKKYGWCCEREKHEASWAGNLNLYLQYGTLVSSKLH